MGIRPIKAYLPKTINEAKVSLEKTFPDFEIEYVVAELQLSANPLETKSSLQIKMKKKPQSS